MHCVWLVQQMHYILSLERCFKCHFKSHCHQHTDTFPLG